MGGPPAPVDEALPVDTGLEETPPPVPVPEAAPGPERPQHTRRRRNRRRLKWSLAVVVVVLLASITLLGVQRVDQPLAQPTLTSPRQASYLVHGSAPVLPWPPSGQAAVAIPALGYAQQSGPETPVPVASLTKMATAVVILHDHPVPLGTSGPPVPVTADDAAQFGVDLDNDETNIPLQAGESISELQMLEALMVESANDVAYTLAVWDSGTEAAFVAKMNALAASLGADHTHFVDASGYQPQSVSTASDMIRIAASGMTIPTFAKVAGMPSATLPLAGTVQNIVKLIGSNGVVGVKSGYTGQAAGCMVLAGYRTIQGHSVLVLASALGQQIRPPAPASPTAPAAPGATTTTTSTVPYNAVEAQYPLLYTGPIVEHLLDTTEAAVTPVPLARPGDILGTATAVWSGARHDVPAVATRGALLLAVPGQRVVVSTEPLATSALTGARDRVGTVRYSLGAESEVVPLRRQHRVPTPTWWWKLLHN
jgi:D-alanyl-D-alanine carboxypeptidase (penicillin-binding protein 5/6)